MTAADRTTWLRHPNAAGPASTLLAIHDQFRAVSQRLRVMVAGTPDLRAVSRTFAPLAAMLHHHHHAEEVMLFPLIERRTGLAPERLVADHQVLMQAIEAVEIELSGVDAKRASAAVVAFDAVLVDHLDREEALVIPVLLELTPREAWALIHG